MALDRRNWIAAIDAFDFNDPEPLEQLRAGNEPVPPELQHVIDAIDSGERKPNKKAAAKLKIPTAERMKILGELWKANICAETMYIDNPKSAKQLDFAFDNGIPLIMWIGEDEIA